MFFLVLVLCFSVINTSLPSLEFFNVTIHEIFNETKSLLKEYNVNGYAGKYFQGIEKSLETNFDMIFSGDRLSVIVSRKGITSESALHTTNETNEYIKAILDDTYAELCLRISSFGTSIRRYEKISEARNSSMTFKNETLKIVRQNLKDFREFFGINGPTRVIPRKFNWSPHSTPINVSDIPDFRVILSKSFAQIKMDADDEIYYAEQSRMNFLKYLDDVKNGASDTLSRSSLVTTDNLSSPCYNDSDLSYYYFRKRLKEVFHSGNTNAKNSFIAMGRTIKLAFLYMFNQDNQTLKEELHKSASNYAEIASLTTSQYFKGISNSIVGTYDTLACKNFNLPLVNDTIVPLTNITV